MEKQCFINNKCIRYTDKGEGSVLILLHGYLETKEVWNSFAEKLSHDLRVITLDIPGHGKSDIMAETHTMELMAEIINGFLLDLKIETCTLVGHSMGAYIMLAFADLFPHKLNGFVLFHSSVYADTEEKKKTRLREIEFINKGKLDLIINTNLPNTFATDTLDNFSEEIERLKNKAKKHNPDGISALTRGMMERSDKQNLIKDFTKPMLFIFGEKDNYIPIDLGKKMSKLNPLITSIWLKNSGHMGFIEEEAKSFNLISKFVDDLHRKQ